MRSWRNWQTRTVQVRVGNRGGSNPLDRTRMKTPLTIEVDGVFSRSSVKITETGLCLSRICGNLLDIILNRRSRYYELRRCLFQ